MNRSSPENSGTSLVKSAEALAASELRYRRLFESAKDGILILDAETGVVVDVNPFLVELLGLTREAILGKAVWELGYLADIVANQDAFKELQVNRYIRYEDKPLKTADGRQVDVEFVSNVYSVNHQRVIQCNIREITERKRAAEALRMSQHFIEGIINTIPARVFWKDRNLVYLGCNKAFARDAGFSDSREIVGKTDYEMVWHDQADLYRSDDRHVIESGRPLLNQEELQATPEGTLITLLTSKVPMRDSEGEIVGILGSYMDITANKRMEAARVLLETAIEQASETVVITDADAKILYVNPAFEKCTGYSREEVVGQNPRILQSGKQDAEFYHRMWEMLGRGEVWNGRMVNKRKDGSLYEEKATISPVRDTAGKIINYVGVKYDVTYEAQLERQLHQAQKLEAVGRLAGGVAHDFNNLLQGIMGFTELSLDEVSADNPAREWLNEIMHAARQSANITRQLLAFASRQVITPRILNLNDTVSGMLKLVRRLIGEHIGLVWRPGPDVGLIRIDPSQVDQILANLCLNARDAIIGVGTITLETRNAVIDSKYCASHLDAKPGKYVLFSVTDDGSGMDSETLEHVFEPFFTTKDVGKGTGLGLATVYGIVTQNNGFIHVYSEMGKGTTFKLYLPLVREAEGENNHIAVTSVPKGRGEIILLVEDEESLRVSCKMVLETLGYKVLLADSPAGALDLADRELATIDLLLTDVVMPGMDGTKLAKRLHERRPDLKVLYMSGYPADVMARRGVLRNDVPFISKPFMRSELACKICELLDGGKARGAL